MILFRVSLIYCSCCVFVSCAKPNVLLVIADNMRPSFGLYGDTLAETPNIDAFFQSPGSTVYSRAYCQVAWCAPSRNSFLSGRYPVETRAYNFLSSFRGANDGKSWLSLPQYFKEHGYHTTSVGKVFHPRLPRRFDYPQSWSDVPFFQDKPLCPNNTMSCELGDSEVTTDRNATVAAIERVKQHLKRNSSVPLFLAVGYQSPRLPWRYSVSSGSRYPPASQFPVPRNRSSPAGLKLEWFRPNEINLYSDVERDPVTHDRPMSKRMVQRVTRAYYSTFVEVDQQFATLVSELDQMGIMENTIVVFMADHGQALGGLNLWSMMSLYETSARVPFMIRIPSSTPPKTCGNPIELVDLYPTLLSLAGLPSNPRLPGKDISPCSSNDSAAVAVTQITRCKSCKLAYWIEPSTCNWDAKQDKNFTVPCVMMPLPFFSYMGSSVRSRDWRASAYCKWKFPGKINWNDCPETELYDHRKDPGIPFNATAFEIDNLASVGKYQSVLNNLMTQLKAKVF